MVSEYFRHGAREPVYEYYDYDSYPSRGELTPVGMRQHYNLGQILRHEYIDKMHFLSPEYDPSEIYVSSTNVNRTIISALAQLYGLYPLGTGPKLANLSDEELYTPPFEINDNGFSYPLNDNKEALPGFFQPIPIHNTGNEDMILRPYDHKICVLNEKWQQAQQQTVFFKDLLQELNVTIQNVKKLMNLTEDIDLKQVEGIYDVFQNDKWAGKPLPAGFQGDLKKNMSFIFDFWYYYVNFGTERQRLTLSGGLFKEVRDFFSNKLQGREEKKWLMYSAHDTTLIMIFSALNLSNYQCVLAKWRGTLKSDDLCIPLPDYASSIIFELHKEERMTTVKVRYNGKYLREYKYDEFERIMNRSVKALEEDEEFLRECGDVEIEAVEKKVKNSHAGVWFLFGVIIGIVLAMVFCMVRSHLIKKKLRLLDVNMTKESDKRGGSIQLTDAL